MDFTNSELLEKFRNEEVNGTRAVNFNPVITTLGMGDEGWAYSGLGRPVEL